MGELSLFHIRWTSPTAVQAQAQGYNLACPIIQSIYDLLEHVKGPDLQTQSCRISHNTGQQ